MSALPSSCLHLGLHNLPPTQTSAFPAIRPLRRAGSGRRGRTPKECRARAQRHSQQLKHTLPTRCLGNRTASRNDGDRTIKERAPSRFGLVQIKPISIKTRAVENLAIESTHAVAGSHDKARNSKPRTLSSQPPGTPSRVLSSRQHRE